MSKIMRDPVILFPPNTKRVDQIKVLKVGDCVEVEGRRRLGVGTVISFNEDGRLVKVSFGSVTGWWNKADLIKEKQ